MGHPAAARALAAYEEFSTTREYDTSFCTGRVRAKRFVVVVVLLLVAVVLLVAVLFTVRVVAPGRLLLLPTPVLVPAGADLGGGASDLGTACLTSTDLESIVCSRLAKT